MTPTLQEHLNAEIRKAQAEAWDEGYTVGNAHNGRRDANPYRDAPARLDVTA